MPHRKVMVQVSPTDSPLTPRQVVGWGTALLGMMSAVVGLVMFFATMKSEIMLLRRDHTTFMEQVRSDAVRAAAERSQSVKKIDELSDKVDALREELSTLSNRQAVSAAILERLDRNEKKVEQRVTTRPAN